MERLITANQEVREHFVSRSGAKKNPMHSGGEKHDGYCASRRFLRIVSSALASCSEMLSGNETEGRGLAWAFWMAEAAERQAQKGPRPGVAGRGYDRWSEILARTVWQQCRQQGSGTEKHRSKQRFCGEFCRQRRKNCAVTRHRAASMTATLMMPNSPPRQRSGSDKPAALTSRCSRVAIRT